MGSQNSKCLLCGKQAKLLRKSHIIPNFMYRGLFDEHNRMYALDLNDRQHSKYVQTGYYDKYLLCHTCDNKLLGGLERYAALLLYGGQSKTANHRITKEVLNEEMDILHVSGISYEKFKLFLLSILWRAHISRNRFFKNIELSDLEPTIKGLVLRNDPGPYEMFRIAILGIRRSDGSLANLIVDPDLKRDGEFHFAHFIINGMIYFIELKPGSGFHLFDNFSLSPNGVLKVPFVSGNMANRYLKGLGVPENIANGFTVK